MFVSPTNSAWGLHGMCVYPGNRKSCQYCKHDSSSYFVHNFTSVAVEWKRTVELDLFISDSTFMNVNIVIWDMKLFSMVVVWVSTFQRNPLRRGDGESYSDDLELASY